MITQAPNAGEGLGLQVVSIVCGNGSCPTIYRSNRGTLVAQGYRVSSIQAGVCLHADESLVEIPVELLVTAARSMS